MARTKGATGKTETKRQLREKIAALEEQVNEWRNHHKGEGNETSTSDLGAQDHPASGVGDAETNATSGAGPSTHKGAESVAVHAGKSTPLTITPPEADTYKCGACQASLDGPLGQCPKCGSMLSWT